MSLSDELSSMHQVIENEKLIYALVYSVIGSTDELFIDDDVDDGALQAALCVCLWLPVRAGLFSRTAGKFERIGVSIIQIR